MSINNLRQNNLIQDLVSQNYLGNQSEDGHIPKILMTLM